MWLVIHGDARDSARVRAVRDYLYEKFRAFRPALAGAAR